MQKVLIIDEEDNVAVAVQPLKKEDEVNINLKSGGKVYKLKVYESIPFGHKIALKAIKKGERVIKYGQAIGKATKHIDKGEHVHTHNVESTKGRGDLQIG